MVEADGGARGNPGPAAFGAVVRDAESGAVLAEVAEAIGSATNNVAEYRGLIAGLRLVREVDADATVEVRMDSKLVIEQMAGRWKIKHADMRRLALEAQRLVPPGTAWTWVPRERNKAADALLNRVLDGAEPVRSVSVGAAAVPSADEVVPAAEPSGPPVGRGWEADIGPPTTLHLLRHGETAHSVAKRFSGTGGDDLPLTERGRVQAERAATALARRGDVTAVVTSPLRRTRETADIVAKALDLPVRVEPRLRETAFGEWDGHTFAEVRRRWPDALERWLGSTSEAPPGGESFDEVDARVRAALDGLLTSDAGRSVVLVTHVTPIKLLVCRALGVPVPTIYRMELAPGSLGELAWYADGRASLREFGLQPGSG